MQAKIIEMFSLILDATQHFLFCIQVRDRPEEILPRLCDVAVGRVEGLKEPEDLPAVLDALRGVDDCYMPSLRVVGAEEG
jgi:hypothetical protein